jgi:threonine dehydrogenase-like Zn-dependent dehydrogenase
LTGFGADYHRVVAVKRCSQSRWKFHRSRLRLISSQVSTLTPDSRWSKDRRLDVAWTLLGRVPVGDLITHSFPVAEAARAYALLDQQPGQAVQVIFNYE